MRRKCYTLEAFSEDFIVNNFFMKNISCQMMNNLTYYVCARELCDIERDRGLFAILWHIETIDGFVSSRFNIRNIVVLRISTNM